MITKKSEYHVHYPFAIDSESGTVATEDRWDTYVRQLIKQVLFTSPGERVNRPDFGCGVRRMVFMPLNSATANLAKVTLYQALEKWLGSAIAVDQIEVDVEESTLKIEIAYTVRARGERKYLNVEVKL
jgi:hypothetical protein